MTPTQANLALILASATLGLQATAVVLLACQTRFMRRADRRARRAEQH